MPPPLKSPNVKAIAGSIRNCAQQIGPAKPEGRALGFIAEALDSVIQPNFDGIIGSLNSPAAAVHEVTVLDSAAGRILAFLGFKAINALQTWGLTVNDLAATQQVAFVGVQLEDPIAITATTNASPDVITAPGNTYLNGETVLIQGATGDTAINIVGIVENVGGGGAFQLTDLLGNPINGNGVYAGGGLVQRFFAGAQAQSFKFGASNQIRGFADGRVVINGVTLTLNANGVTTTIGNLLFAGVAGVAGLNVKNNAASSQDVVVTDRGFLIRASDQATYVVNLTAPGSDQGHLVLKKLATTFAATLDAQLGLTLVDNAGTPNTGRMNATQLLLGTKILMDANSPEIDVGAAGSAQSILTDSGLNVAVPAGPQSNVLAASIRTQNSTNTRFVQLSSAGTATGTDVGGTTWLISGAGVSGNDGVGTWSLTGSALSIQGSQIVGPRLAAVANVAGAAGATYTAVEQGLINSLITQLNLALARLRSHGLIS